MQDKVRNGCCRFLPTSLLPHLHPHVSSTITSTKKDSHGQYFHYQCYSPRQEPQSSEVTGQRT